MAAKNARTVALATMLLFTVQFSFTQSSIAQSAGSTPNPPTPFNLDLTSTNHNTVSNILASHGPQTITEGGVQKTFSAGANLTPAERLAIYQVYSSPNHTQSITLAGNGTATGGSLTMGANFSNYVSGVVLPAGVTATRNVSTAGNLNLTGNLVNSGAVYAYSTSPAVPTATFSAANITNNQSGIISTILPTALASTLGSALVSNLHLALAATNNIVNAGTISSSGNLNLTAGSSITNTLPAGLTGAGPIMQAAGNLSLFTGSGLITNAGLISALAGNINVNTLASQNLTIANTGGLMQALNGAISVRDASYTGSAGVNIVGGVLDSRSINMYCGTGAFSAQVQQVIGRLNVNAGSTDIRTMVGPLVLGRLDLTGDPIIRSGNDVFVSGDISVSSGDLIITSDMGNILADPGNPPALIEDTDPAGIIQLNAPQGSISLTGVTIVDSAIVPLPSGPGLIPASIAIAAAGDVSVGSIYSSAGSVLVRAGADFSNGIFFPPSQPGTGNLQVGTIDLSSQNNKPSPAPGHGFMLLEAGNTLTTGAINGNGGLITISSLGTVNLSAPKGPVIINNSVIGQDKSQITINAGQGVTIDSKNIAASGASLQMTAGGTLAFVQPMTVDVSAAAGTNEIGGRIDIVAQAMTMTGPLALHADGDGTGPGGRISLQTAAPLVVGGGGVTASARGGSGGAAGGAVIMGGQQGLTVDGSAIDVAASGAQGNGGAISLFTGSFSGPAAQGGPLTITGTLNADGSGTGNGGTITIGANGRQDDLTIDANTVISAQSGTDGGDGGSVTLTAGRNVTLTSSTIHLSPRGKDGSGGFVELDANLGRTNGNITVNGDLSVNGKGVGNGGTILLDPIIQIEPPPIAITVNGNLSASAGEVGTGGTILLEGSGDIVVGNASSLKSMRADGGTTSGDGGGITVTTNANATLNTSLISASAQGNGNGGFINIATGNSGTGTLAIGGDIGVDGQGSAGNGGSVALRAPTITASGTRNEHISANGAGTGNGGNVMIQSTDSANNLTMGRGRGQLTVSATGGSAASASGDGGSIWVQVGGDLVIADGTALAVNPIGMNGQGGSMNLVANAGTLGVSGLLNGNGAGTGNGGTITLGSSGLLTVDSSLDADGGAAGGAGGNISITSIAGDVVVGSAGTTRILARGGSRGGNGGSVSIFAAGNLTESGQIVASARGGNANGGTILISSGSSGSGDVTVNDLVYANGAGAGNGGTISLVTNGLSPLEITSSISARAPAAGTGGTITFTTDEQPGQGSGTLDLTLDGNVSVGSGTGQAGSIYFTAEGSPINVTAAAAVIGNIHASGSSVAITATALNSTLTIANINATAGDVNLTTTNIVSAQNVSVQPVVNASGNVNLTANYVDPLGFHALGFYANPLNADPGKHDFTAGSISATVIKITTLVNGDITQTAGSTWDAATTYLTSAGDIGTVANPVHIAGGTLQVTAPGALADVILSNTTPVNLLPSTVGRDFRLTSNSDISVNNNITVGRNLNFSTTANNANIFISANISANTRIDLAANGGGNISQVSPSASLISPTVALTSQMGNIGSAGNAIAVFALTTARVVTASGRTAGGGVYISSSGATNVDVSNSGPGNNIEITSADNMIVIGAVTAGNKSSGGDISLLANNAQTQPSSITINNTVTADGGTVLISANGDVSANRAVTGQDVNINTSSGSNGNIAINSRVTGHNSVTIAADGMGNITGSANGLITTDDPLIANTGTITLSTGSAYSPLAGSIGSALRALDISTDILSATTFPAPSSGVPLGSGTGNIYIAQIRTGLAIDTLRAGNVASVICIGDLYIHNPAQAGQVITADPIEGQTVSLATDGHSTLNVGGINIVATKAIKLLTVSGDITQAVSNSGSYTAVGNLAAPNVQLISSDGNIGSLVTTQTSNGVTTTTVHVLNLFISASGLAFNTNSRVDISQSGNGAFVGGADQLAISFGNSKQQVNIIAEAPIIVGGPVSGSAIVLRTAPGSVGDISIGAKITATGALTLIADEAGSIINTGGSLTANTISMMSQQGNIGTAAAPIMTTTTRLGAVTGGQGNVYVSNSRALVGAEGSAGNVFQLINNGSLATTNPITANTVNLSSTAGSAGSITIGAPVNAISGVSISSGGALSINSNIIASGGSIVASATRGAIRLGSGVVLSANEGNLTLQNNDTLLGSIVVGQNVQLSASATTASMLGNVYLGIGPVPASPVAGTTPRNVTVNASNGGTVSFGSNSISAKCCNNIVNINGSSVVFSTGTLPASAINLGGNVTISASDPAEIALLDDSAAPGSSDYLPVAFVERQSLTFPRAEEATATVHTAEGTGFGQIGAGSFVLLSGEALVAAHDNTIVKSGQIVIEADKQSVLLLKRQRNLLVIRNLHDRRVGSVVVTIARRKYRLSPGEEVCVRGLQDKIMNDDVSARRTLVEQYSSDCVIERSEFSFPSLCGRSELMKHFLSNDQQYNDKSLVRQVLKTAACLSILSASHGGYAPAPAPRR